VQINSVNIAPIFFSWECYNNFAILEHCVNIAPSSDKSREYSYHILIDSVDLDYLNSKIAFAIEFFKKYSGEML